jgi:cation/acetate symporter
VVLTLLSKSVWVDVLHRAHALVFLDNPALVSVPLTFGGIWIFSMLDRGAREQQEREAFARQEFYGQTCLVTDFILSDHARLTPFPRSTYRIN